MTAEEIEAGLTNEEEGVRNAFARRKDYTPIFCQVERGLKDDFAFVRMGWTCKVVRDGIVLTEAQIERVLNDESSNLSRVFKRHEAGMRIRLERQKLNLAVKDITPNQPKPIREMTL